VLILPALAAAAVVALPAAADHGGKDCTEITGGGANYSQAAGTLNVQVTLAAKACSPHVLFVWDDATQTTLIATVGQHPDGDNTIEWLGVDVSANNDDTVCIKVVNREDEAPNVGCLEVTDGTPPDQSGFA
jgi:hypothetical protein